MRLRARRGRGAPARSDPRLVPVARPACAHPSRPRPPRTWRARHELPQAIGRHVYSRFNEVLSGIVTVKSFAMAASAWTPASARRRTRADRGPRRRPGAGAGRASGPRALGPGRSRAVRITGGAGFQASARKVHRTAAEDTSARPGVRRGCMEAVAPVSLTDDRLSNLQDVPPGAARHALLQGEGGGSPCGTSVADRGAGPRRIDDIHPGPEER